MTHTGVLAVSSDNFCRYCKKNGHLISECHRLQAKKKKDQEKLSKPFSHTAAVTDTSGSITLNELQALLNQITGHSSSSALSATPGISSPWYFDSGCCNHMTYASSALVNKSSRTTGSIICIADNSGLNITHTGDISTVNLSAPDAFFVPKLALNLLSMGQLCELSLEVCFSNNGCHVQDPQTGQVLGTARKVGRLFEAISLDVTNRNNNNCAAATLSQDTWHSQLGHISSSRLESLISGGVLGHVK